MKINVESVGTVFDTNEYGFQKWFDETVVPNPSGKMR